MQSLFNYQTLNVTLLKSTRTLRVELNRGNNNAINLEMLFELESLLAWASNKVEIRSLLMTSSTDLFSEGFNKSHLEKLNENQIIKINEKLQKIVHAMIHLPQTIIVDLKDGASNLGCELSLGADIRIASSNVALHFNHSNFGLTPGGGGMGLLTAMVGQLNARNWLLSSKKIKVNKLLETGFLIDTYSKKEEQAFITEELLEDIYAQSPVARIQTKLGILSPFIEQFEKANQLEKRISKATLATGDWKNESTDEAMKAKSMSYSVKLSLVKNDESPSLRN